MPVEILIPKLGLTMTECEIVEWKKKEGDKVSAKEVIFVLETEKVAYEVEAQEDGILGRILAAEGDTVPVGAVVGYILKPGESSDDLAQAPAPTGTTEKVEVVEAQAPEPPVQAAATAGTRVRATPLAKKIAKELGVALFEIRGTGSTGRIVADDVKKAAALPKVPQAFEAPSEKLVPLNSMRKTIARNMMAAKTQTAQTYMSLTVDASAILKYRKLLLPVVEKKYEVRLTITDLMMKVTGAAITDHPIINTRWTDEGVAYMPVVHMGMAMALDEGLIVPVIRDINSKGLGRIAHDRTEVIRKCREKEYGPDDIKGSTFTLSTLGMFGIESFTANINLPESAILAVGAAIDKPVVVDGQIVIRPMMNVTLTYDHRIIDGAEAGKFMQTLKAYLEEPFKILS